MSNKIFHLFTISSLEKVFADEPFLSHEIVTHDTMLLGERYSFQAAYCLENSTTLGKAKLCISGTIADYVQIRQTGLVPSQLPNYPDGDDYVLRKTPGLYPDPLFPLSSYITLIPEQWHSLWITIPADCPLPSGSYDLILTFYEQGPQEGDGNAHEDASNAGTLLGSCTYHLRRLNAVLPKQTLIHTQWFHTDCIANQYDIPVFSERYWELVERYMHSASLYGINMLLTPLFTPPLDTKPGGERTTVQLVDVYLTEHGYKFDFNKLERWISLCEQYGIVYLEFSHLFTQWGAAHAPKIMAFDGIADTLLKDTKPLKIFGWDTASSSEEYIAFLDAFLIRLMEFIEEHHLHDRCYFHISDEPHKEHLPIYLQCREVVKRHIGDLPIMDAISDYEYYEHGIIDLPICSTDHLEPFIEHQVPNLWTYYCCGQYKEVSNRFFCMPSVRNRILGVQLYQYQIQGFLQWGFNFWNAFLSTRTINPFYETDAGCALPSGDAFLVYPGEDGPIGSLRGEVFVEGLQDLRMLQLLEELTDRETVMRLIHENLEETITFKKYPHDSSWLLRLRKKCHEMIEAYNDARP